MPKEHKLKKYRFSKLDFTEDELLLMQSIGGIYDDLESEEEIYSEKDCKPYKP